MAKEIDKIIQSKTAPKSNNVLWDDGENLKINRNGKWESIGSNDLSTQVFTIPYEIIIELSERVEIEDGVFQAVPINALEEYYGVDWDLMVDIICKYGFVTMEPHVPFYFYRMPNELGTGYCGITLYFLTPDNLTQMSNLVIQNKAQAEITGFGNYGIIMING